MEGSGAREGVGIIAKIVDRRAAAVFVNVVLIERFESRTLRMGPLGGNPVR